MRLLYRSEGPIDTLLQIAAGPIRDGDLISKQARDEFVEFGWVSRCEGFNIITHAGSKVIYALRLGYMIMTPLGPNFAPVINLGKPPRG